MKRSVFIKTCLASFLYLTNNIGGEVLAEASVDNYTVNMKRDMLVLMMAYPEYTAGVAKGEGDRVYLVMKSGQKILYDDKRSKSVSEKENNPDLQDMLEQIYPLNDINDIMPRDFDPGRVRVYALLNEVYGGSQRAIENNLVTVNIGRRYQFNKNNNAAKSLENAVKDTLAQSKQNSRIGGFLYPMSGTFNYRRIAGTARLSPHSYGIAIDLKSDKKDYWKWASKEEGKKRLNSYPREIVISFENNYFVWGGKWNHFDILHFEYRPELILKARYFGNQLQPQGNWYDGVPVDNEQVKSKIGAIDSVIE
jgi:hypothetical protein